MLPQLGESGLPPGLAGVEKSLEGEAVVRGHEGSLRGDGGHYLFKSSLRKRSSQIISLSQSSALKKSRERLWSPILEIRIPNIIRAI
jgi:hypothetical protein